MFKISLYLKHVERKKIEKKREIGLFYQVLEERNEDESSDRFLSFSNFCLLVLEAVSQFRAAIVLTTRLYIQDISIQMPPPCTTSALSRLPSRPEFVLTAHSAHPSRNMQPANVFHSLLFIPFSPPLPRLHFASSSDPPSFFFSLQRDAVTTNVTSAILYRVQLKYSSDKKFITHIVL